MIAMVTGRRSFGGLVSTNIVSLTGQFHSLAVNFPFFFHALCKRFKPVVAVLPSRVHNAVESWERGGDGCEKTKSNRQRKSDSSHKNSCGHCIPHTANNLTFSDGVTCSLLSLWEMGHDFAIRVKSERECLFQYQRKIILTETISWKIKNMPRLNFRILLFAVACCFLCSGITIRDRVLIESLHHIERQALVRPTERQLFEGAMYGIFDALGSLGDDYSAYIPSSQQKEYEDNLENRFEGIGIVLRQFPEIVYPLIGSPAWNAGIRAGDRIVAVDAQKTDGMPFGKLLQLIRGPSDTEVVLTVFHRKTTEPVDIRVKRGPIQRNSVEGFTLDDEGNRLFSLPTESELAYLRITSFSDMTAAEVEDGLRCILDGKKKGLVLDLRGNPGGYISSCVAVANFFVEPNGEHDLIVSTRYRSGYIKGRYRAFGEEKFFDLPMVVLIDGESASAAEILSACLQDYCRAKIVGTRSFGKGTVQEIFDLPISSGKYQLTDASYWRPNGRNINRDNDAGDNDEWGVTPDPDGLVPISEDQQFAQDIIRELRSNIIAADGEEIIADLLKRIPREIERSRSEKKEEKTEPFQLQGTAPYYDPQLEKAIELLKDKIS